MNKFGSVIDIIIMKLGSEFINSENQDPSP